MIIETRVIRGGKGAFLEVKAKFENTEVDLGWHDENQARKLLQSLEEAIDEISSFLEE